MRLCHRPGRRAVRCAAAMLLVGSVLSAQVSAAVITPSQTNITLAQDAASFSVDLSLSEDALFAGAEFGLDLPTGMTLDSVTFLGTATQQANHSPEVTVDGRTFFGFYAADNRFSGSLPVARLLFTYDGSADATIRLGSSKIVTVLPDGSTKGDTASSAFSVTVTRAGGGHSGDGDSPGGDAGGGDSSGGGSSGGGSGGGASGGSSPDQPTVTLPDASTPLAGGLTFYDVPASHWAFEIVQTAVERGLFTGTSSSTFSPDAAVTRGMLVTVLHRMEGKPAGGRQPFTDVPAGAYYADAVAWAAANGIVLGVSPTAFAPDAAVTREQIAAILYRYAQLKQHDTAARAALDAFGDESTISAYAREPLSWANAKGLISGRDATTLAPNDTATRAEAAAILVRYQDQIT